MTKCQLKQTFGAEFRNCLKEKLPNKVKIKTVKIDMKELHKDQPAITLQNKNNQS